MGQKAKNAGKKVSKTCDKKANGMSMHCKGSRFRAKVISYDDFLRVGGGKSHRWRDRGNFHSLGGMEIIKENNDE